MFCDEQIHSFWQPIDNNTFRDQHHVAAYIYYLFFLTKPAFEHAIIHLVI